ncbi:hypothetical protein CC78DRAFT_192275 [Lojkania enalia]|uniref:Uncharacterized protein n=1 Tax=Lojkania enalia TaxID=147567 RepID=A0A9P4NBE2_9PLEO|nr:hypothetical protein CC78DRAFT_192275 [Didymosphaeria enalia]
MNSDKDDEGAGDHEDEGNARKQKRRIMLGRSRMLEKCQTKREKDAKKRVESKFSRLEEPTGMLDLENVTNESNYVRKRMHIKICGRYIHNYPSEKVLNSGEWYHFSIIAKDSELYNAIELYRNWNEFFKLIILCVRRYFPAPKWTIFAGDILRKQLLYLTWSSLYLIMSYFPR